MVERDTYVQIAVITEEVEVTGWGSFCAVLLVLHNIAIFLWLLSAKSAFQETVVAVAWTGGNVLWGLGVALGRRRKMRVYRIQEPIEPAME